MEGVCRITSATGTNSYQPALIRVWRISGFSLSWPSQRYSRRTVGRIAKNHSAPPRSKQRRPPSGTIIMTDDRIATVFEPTASILSRHICKRTPINSKPSYALYTRLLIGYLIRLVSETRWENIGLTGAMFSSFNANYRPFGICSFAERE
jgi:hypothetical protein